MRGVPYRDEDDAVDAREQAKLDEETRTKRAASGISPEELSLQDAFIEGTKSGHLGHGRGMNPFQDFTPEHAEWERGRMSTLGLAHERKTA